MKIRLLLITLVLAVVAGVAWRLDHRAAGGGHKQKNEHALKVKTVPVVVRDFPLAFDLPATLEAVHQVALVSQVGGVLLHQRVQEGEPVRAGQALFEVDARLAKARVAQASAALGGAEAEIAEAQKKLDRLQPLLPPGYVSRQEFDDARLALESARARADAARAERDAARLDVAHATLSSPIAGHMGRVAVREGELVVAGGTALATVVGQGALVARAGIAARDWPQLEAARRSGPVKGEVRAAGGHVLAHGTLIFVDNRIDPASGTVAIKFSLDDAPASLLDGQIVSLRLVMGHDANALVVPGTSVQVAQDGAYVYVVRDGHAVQETVEVRRELDGDSWISGGVKAGEPVLVEIPQRLKNGDAVSLTDAKPKRP